MQGGRQVGILWAKLEWFSDDDENNDVMINGDCRWWESKWVSFYICILKVKTVTMSLKSISKVRWVTFSKFKKAREVFLHRAFWKPFIYIWLLYSNILQCLLRLPPFLVLYCIVKDARRCHGTPKLHHCIELVWWITNDCLIVHNGTEELNNIRISICISGGTGIIVKSISSGKVEMVPRCCPDACMYRTTALFLCIVSMQRSPTAACREGLAIKQVASLSVAI